LQLLVGLHTPTTGKVDDRWRRFMKFQIERAEQYFADAEAGVDLLDPKARWPVWWVGMGCVDGWVGPEPGRR
jgi:phytoene synthase